MEELPIPSYGPGSYDGAVAHLSNVLSSEKKRHYSSQAMIVGLEGPSNSGKTTLAEHLKNSVHSNSLEMVVIEGDRFQVIKPEGMKVYEATLEALDKGEEVPEDFPERIWRYDEMKTQLFDKVKSFNQADFPHSALLLYNTISSDKMTYNDSPEQHPLSRDTVVVVPGMYLRHLPNFDMIFELQVDPEISVARKIERDKERQYPRPPELTRRMVVDIEHGISKKRRDQYEIKRGATMNTDDFNSVSIVGIN